MAWAVEVSYYRFVVVLMDVPEVLHEPIPKSLSGLSDVRLGALLAYQVID